MATNEELEKMIKVLQNQVSSLQDGFEKYEAFLSNTVETKQLKVSGDAQICDRDINQTLNNHDQNLREHQGTLSQMQTQLSQLQNQINAVDTRLSSLQTGVENGSIIVQKAVFAQKALMLRARNNYHWLRCNGTDSGNFDCFGLWTTDNKWYPLIRVAATGDLPRGDVIEGSAELSSVP